MMAGGMDWFRWHHGTVTDQKFILIARKSGCSVAEVISVWACLLEMASMATERGTIGDPDFDAINCALGLEDGKAQRIYDQMQSRGIANDGGRITAWEKRQPKRERPDDFSSDRVKALRQMKRHVTPCNAMERTETPRREESRQEQQQREASIDARFERFWKAYPKKIGKGAAEKAWVKAHINGEFDSLLTALEDQKKTDQWKKDGGQFIPNPATWLNQKRWLDGDKSQSNSLFAGVV